RPLRWPRCTTAWASSGSSRASQSCNLGGGELPPLARGEVPESEAGVDRAVECSDWVADLLAHPAHLALAPLVEHELDPRRREAANAGGRRDAVVERDALGKPAQVSAGWFAL